MKYYIFSFIEELWQDGGHDSLFMKKLLLKPTLGVKLTKVKQFTFLSRKLIQVKAEQFFFEVITEWK